MASTPSRAPSDTELSFPNVAEGGIPRDTAEISQSLLTPGTYIPGRPGLSISAPGAIVQSSRDSHVALPSFHMPPRDKNQNPYAVPLDQLFAAHKVSSALEAVDATKHDTPLDARVFEKEPVSMRSASCAAFSTKLDDTTVRQIISKTGTQKFEKVSTSNNGQSVWIYARTGERSPVPTAEIYDEIREASAARNFPVPSVMFLSYPGQQDVSCILQTFKNDIGNSFSLLSTNDIFVGDEAFMLAVQHPRVKVYVDVDISSRPARQLRGKLFYDMTLKPAIHTIRAGGADKEYGREKEEKILQDWIDETFRTGAYSSMTIHGDAMMGKTRRAAETVRYMKQKYPDATLVFAPAMDTHKSDPFHYCKTFAKRLVDGFASQPVISKTIVYRQLAAFVSGETTDVSLDDFSSLLVTFFQLLPSSSAKLFMVPDDMQWPDTESNFFLKKIFAQNATFGNMAVLNLTRTGDEVMSPELLAAMQSKTSGEMLLKPLPFLDKNGEPTELLRSFVSDLLRLPTFDIPFATDYLKRLGKMSQGNGGILTEIVRSMNQEGVISTVLGSLSVDHTRFMSWTEAGEADNIVVTKVDRLLKNESYRDVLLHLVAFRESGECDSDLFVKFLMNVLKRPDLVKAYEQLVAQQTIGLQQIDDRDDGNLSFSQDLVGSRLKKQFTEGSSPFGVLYADAHRNIAKFMFDMERRVDARKNPQMMSILGRCSSQAIFTHARAAKMEKLSAGYAIQALRDAYSVGDHAATMDIYQSAVQDNPELLAQIENDDDLQLSLLHSMTILRKDWGPAAIAIGDKLKEKYLGLLAKSSQYSEALISKIEHLYDLMCTFYFLRGTASSLRAESIKKLTEWGEGFGQNFHANAEQNVKLKKGAFMSLKQSFYLMLAEYMQQRYAQACEMYSGQFELRRRDLCTLFPEIEQDPRLQRLNLEATRIGANSWLMGHNRAQAPGLEGVVYAYEDEESCIVSTRDPKSPMHEYLLLAEDLFRSYLNQAAERPDQIMDRGQVYRAKQGFARTLGNLGKYHESFEVFLDARSDAHRYGDQECFSNITDSTSSMLCNMAKHFLADPDNQDLQKMIISIASLIRRSERGGESLDDQDMFASLQYILKKAYQYSEQAARIAADISHSNNNDMAVVNMLLVIETMVDSFNTLKRSMDPDTLFLLQEILEVALLPGEKVNGRIPPSFFERMVKFEKNGKSGEYWNLYVAPCLARLALHSTQFSSAEIREVFSPLLKQLGDCVEGRANLLHSLIALVEERRTPTKARLPSYDRAVDAKLNAVMRAMNLLEQRDLMRYSTTDE